MAGTITSLGIGSGLDVNSIVSQLVAIEKQPLQPLQAKAVALQTQLSKYGTIQAQMAALSDAATALADPKSWAIQAATSSNTAAVTVSASATATPTSFSLNVTQLARAQTTGSVSVAAGSTLGTGADTGNLTISLGSWATGSFVGNGSASVSVAISGADTFSTIASKINAANAGVTATVLSSGGQEQLTFQSTATGQATGFQIAASGFAGLNSLSYTAPAATASATGMALGQSGLDANATINGVAVTSASNTLTNIPGLTMNLAQVTTAPVQITVAQDQTAVQKNIQTFVSAYNAVEQTLADSTRYVPGGQSGVLQGDATTIGLQNMLSNILGSTSTGSTYTRISDVGLQRQADGTLSINTTKLNTAMQNMTNLQSLFTANNSNNATNGFALKMRDFAKGVLATNGTVMNKESALQGSITRNGDEQDRVNTRAARVEAQLRQQYSALDVQMAQMSSLSSYVTAQLAQWNKKA